MSATLQSETWTLDDALRLMRLDHGHDFARWEEADGATTAVYGLGVNSAILDVMRAKMPGYAFTERRRIRAADGDGEWVRVDVEIAAKLGGAAVLVCREYKGDGTITGPAAILVADDDAAKLGGGR